MLKPTRFYSKRQETKVAKVVNGTRAPNSGATKFKKGDVSTDQFLIECKTLADNRKSITIQKDWLEKNEEESFAMGKLYSALCFDYGPDSKTRYYIIPEKLFIKLQNFLKEENDE